MRFTVVFAVSLFAFAGAAHAQSVKDSIYSLAGEVRNEVFSSSAPTSSLERARADLASAISLIRGGGGGGGGGGEIFCKRIRDTEYYAPARLSDGEWLQDNGTSLDDCRRQVSSAGYGLYCSRIRDTDYYSPRLVSDKTWRGDNGTDLSTCERQLRGARSGVFCQRIRDTDYYAPARISSGEWLQDNGVSLEQCVTSIGGFERLMQEPAFEATLDRVVEPKLPVNGSPAVR